MSDAPSDARRPESRECIGFVMSGRPSEAQREARGEVAHLRSGQEVGGAEVRLRARVQLGIEPAVVGPRVEVAAGERERWPSRRATRAARRCGSVSASATSRSFVNDASSMKPPYVAVAPPPAPPPAPPGCSRRELDGRAVGEDRVAIHAGEVVELLSRAVIERRRQPRECRPAASGEKVNSAVGNGVPRNSALSGDGELARRLPGPSGQRDQAVAVRVVVRRRGSRVVRAERQPAAEDLRRRRSRR